jgi:putative nucleotidyltransferase with HDIG domain
VSLRHQAEDEILATNESLQHMIRDVAEVMGSIIETRDPYTQGHQLRVAEIAGALAVEMGLTGDMLDCIEMASLLHDIGKLSVPAEILSKPGKLSDVEFSLIKEHSQRGHDILERIAFPWPIADIVLQHHERCDGSGYPLGLSGDAILLPASIISVADVLEAMASFRPYRASLGADAAMAEITGHPEKYCPEVVAAAVSLHERGGLGI